MFSELDPCLPFTFLDLDGDTILSKHPIRCFVPIINFFGKHLFSSTIFCPMGNWPRFTHLFFSFFFLTLLKYQPLVGAGLPLSPLLSQTPAVHEPFRKRHFSEDFKQPVTTEDDFSSLSHSCPSPNKFFGIWSNTQSSSQFAAEPVRHSFPQCCPQLSSHSAKVNFYLQLQEKIDNDNNDNNDNHWPAF